AERVDLVVSVVLTAEGYAVIARIIVGPDQILPAVTRCGQRLNPVRRTLLESGNGQRKRSQQAEAVPAQPMLRNDVVGERSPGIGISHDLDPVRERITRIQ